MPDSRSRRTRRRDTPRIVALSAQALGFILIVLFETLLPEHLVRPAQAITLAAMLVAALYAALLRRYYRNRSLKDRDHESFHDQ
ncbi:hypothetical protein GCM10010082_21420 [Kushneria pakistanensis]|uniref:Uncharacterized protein n=1 Tax=Kushneria pakistanensis TaxID=1508770 RepID=A0ABQ3FKC5_9GAMM|nr:hypothetical protein [Kushneria pakistanensis]GHC27914.1 hypothetical protein GCM10010082_21420 [Kushneria pakistanensis]